MSKDSSSTDLFLKVGLIILAILIWAFIGWAILKGSKYQVPPEINPQNEQKERKTDLLFTDFVLVEQNSLKAVISPYHIKPQVLGMLIDTNLQLLIDKGLTYKEAVLLEKIADCESDWRNICNVERGCKAGQGIFQLIPSTVKYCEQKLEKKIDPFNKNDNLECAVWLLTETSQGINHWGYPSWDSRGYINGKRWGSWDCWSGYLD